jgi:hypothetical protein
MLACIYVPLSACDLYVGFNDINIIRQGLRFQSFRFLTACMSQTSYYFSFKGPFMFVILLFSVFVFYICDCVYVHYVTHVLYVCMCDNFCVLVLLL